MTHVIDRAAWSPDEHDEFEETLARVVAVSTDTTERLNYFDELLAELNEAGRPWASELARSSRRAGLSGEIKRYQDRQRALVAYNGKVLSLPKVQARKVIDLEGVITHQRELIELWTWEELFEKRREAIQVKASYSEKVAHYDRLLALRDLAPESVSPASAAEILGLDLDAWLASAA